eukprot:SAG11_NODE_34178_length_273_cov_0.885057_2_plen_27_part_01
MCEEHACACSAQVQELMLLFSERLQKL